MKIQSYYTKGASELKFLLSIFMAAPVINVVLAYFNDEKYVQPFSVIFMFVMGVCTLAICNSIEKQKVNQ